MNHRWLLLLLALVLARVEAYDSARHDMLFEMGSSLVEPYLKYSDNVPADPGSEEGRAAVTEGIAALEEVIKLNPRNGAAYYFIGMARRALGEYRDAVEAFGHAYEIDPDQPEFAREFAYSTMCAGDTAEAVAISRNNSQNRPEDAGLLANLGLALLADGQFAEARRATQRSLELAPADDVTKRLLREIESVENGKARSRYCP